MGASKYRVTASTGGWRMVPWPFGLLEVRDNSLHLRSQLWAWWVNSKAVQREAITAIEVSRRFGTATLHIKSDAVTAITVQISGSPEKMIQDLRHRGYPIT
jgi:hypothetical protein